MVQHQLAQLRGQWMAEGIWSLETPEASWRMRVSDGEIAFSTDSALRAQLVMMVELHWLSVAQAQMILDRGMPLQPATLPMLSPAQFEALQLRWFRDCLANWLQEEQPAIRQHLPPAMALTTWCTLGLVEAHIQLSWIAEALAHPLPDLDSWVCAVPGVTIVTSEVALPGWRFGALAESILKQCKAPIRLAQLQEASQGIDLLWACEQLRSQGALLLGERSAEVLGFSGPACAVDIIPSILSSEVESGLDIGVHSIGHQEAYLAAERLCTHFSLSVFVRGEETPSVMAQKLYRAAYRLPLHQQESCLQQLDQWWRQWF